MLEIHEKKNFEGYEDIINKIGREELRIIEMCIRDRSRTVQQVIFI